MARTLLLVDDSVTIQRVIELTFAGEPIDVVAVGNGDEAIARVDSTPPDIVLADVGMPGRNGYEVAQHIKRTPTLSHIPVVLLTGTADPVDQARAVEAGCDAVLVKPFEPQQVITCVQELLGSARSGDRREELDRYFARLDQELTALASAPSDPVVAQPRESTEPVAAIEPPPAAASRALPSLADAFAAILEAEGKDEAFADWPTPSTPTLNADAIEQIVERVIRRFSESAVQNRVDDIVTRVAERLVRAEIERIKSSIN